MYKVQFVYFDSPTIMCDNVVEIELITNGRESYKDIKVTLF